MSRGNVLHSWETPINDLVNECVEHSPAHQRGADTSISTDSFRVVFIAGRQGSEDVPGPHDDHPPVLADPPALPHVESDPPPDPVAAPVPMDEEPPAPIPAAEPKVIRAKPGEFSFKWGPFRISQTHSHGVQVGWGLLCRRHLDAVPTGKGTNECLAVNLMFGFNDPSKQAKPFVTSLSHPTPALVLKTGDFVLGPNSSGGSDSRCAMLRYKIQNVASKI